MNDKNSKKITILDGGMGRELKRIGAPFRQPEWSALALMEAPEMVAMAHNNFIEAGAQVITTNAYALVPFHIGDEMFQDQAYDLAYKAAQIARECAVKSNESVKVAGCIPPAFGSYQPDLFDREKLEDILTPLIRAQEQDVDFWLVETVSSIVEAQSVVDLILRVSDLPIWLSFTLENRGDLKKNSVLRSGESLEKIEPFLTQVDALLFNCSQPEEMEDAIRIIRKKNEHIPIGVYPNSFSEIKREHSANENFSTLREDITPEIFLEYAKKWSHAGATIIGGCCGITPDHIASLTHLKTDC